MLLWQRSDLWRADLGSLSPISKEALALDSSLRADLSAGDARTLVVVQGPNLQATLEATESVARTLDGLQERGVIGGYDSVTRWLPSLATQKARQAALPDSATLQTALAQATSDGPLRAARLAPFVADVDKARTLAAARAARAARRGLEHDHRRADRAARRRQRGQPVAAATAAKPPGAAPTARR